VSQLVHGLSSTFSHLVSTEILEKIHKVSVKGRTYIEEIPPNQWRSTCWVDDPRLPPRYGIVTSNMSESTNNMFAGAREGSWLLSLDYILGKMMERIADLRKKVGGNDGVIDTVVSKLKAGWISCGGYKIIELGNNGNTFTISRVGGKAIESTSRFTINLSNRKCTCGEWQEHGYPCVDALAYLQLERKLSFNKVLDEYVDFKYTYSNAREMLSANIMPVCMDTIAPDGVSFPPKNSSKRGSGRPKKQRIRKRSRFAHNPEESNVVCSKCKRRGHNIRTCATRAWMEKEAAKKAGNDSNDMDYNDVLDLS
jgi:hypothetical protein